MSKGEMSEKKKLTGSNFAKIIAYFLLAISIFICGISAAVTLYMAVHEVYSYGSSYLGLQSWVEELLSSSANEDISEYYNLKWRKDEKEALEQLNDFCKGKNIRIEVWREYDLQGEEAKCILSNYDGFDTPYVYSHSYQELTQLPMEKQEEEADNEEVKEEAEEEIAESPVILLEEEEKQETAYAVVSKENEEAAETEKYKDVWVWYEIRLYVDPSFSEYDNYYVSFGNAESLWKAHNVFPAAAAISFLAAAVCFLFLMSGAGHKNGKSGITSGVLTPIHLDILTVGVGIAAVLGIVLGVEGGRGLDTMSSIVFFVLAATAVGVLATIYCAELALRFKLGQWWKHTIIYIVCCKISKVFRFLANIIITLIKGIPLIAKTVTICAGGLLIELFLISAGCEIEYVWICEKVVVIPLILYIALVCKRLQEGSAALAEGKQDYKIDTSKMTLDFKEHGENLNRIGEGIAKAVNERMKSEHLKTELITNVSHDIKTPLTSIINYADLLGNAASAENHLSQEKVAEYSEVLLRQSKRLKKLLEDLVEASKATTGNIEVRMEKCQIGVLLSQAVGEYESRFWEKQLELIVKQPEEPVWIMADGRRLWRVFDNLLSNVCKYAQENTRVYLTVAQREKQVEIVFRNMSKYALDMTGEELEERFTRGDKSRHLEGNGLGLSIAKSLVELQQGAMEIVTDGDLFKVTLKFEVL